MSAEIQWNRSRVAGSMLDASPAQTETDNSITFIAAKPATPRQRSRNCICAASSRSIAPAALAAGAWDLELDAKRGDEALFQSRNGVDVR